MGCNRDPDEIISAARVENIEIHVSETETGRELEGRQLSLVVATVRLKFWDGCSAYHDTEYLVERSILSGSTRIDIPIWQDGDTIKIEITQSEYTGPDECDTAEHYHDKVIVIGLCFPGNYTLRVNHSEKMFTVNPTNIEG